MLKPKKISQSQKQTQIRTPTPNFNRSYFGSGRRPPNEHSMLQKSNNNNNTKHNECLIVEAVPHLEPIIRRGSIVLQRLLRMWRWHVPNNADFFPTSTHTRSSFDNSRRNNDCRKRYRWCNGGFSCEFSAPADPSFPARCFTFDSANVKLPFYYVSLCHYGCRMRGMSSVLSLCHRIDVKKIWMIFIFLMELRWKYWFCFRVGVCEFIQNCPRSNMMYARITKWKVCSL